MYVQYMVWFYSRRLDSFDFEVQPVQAFLPYVYS